MECVLENEKVPRTKFQLAEEEMSIVLIII